VSKYKDLEAEQLFELSLAVQLLTRVAEVVYAPPVDNEESKSKQKDNFKSRDVQLSSATISI